MNTLASAEIFFIISSVGFVVLWILVAIFLVYLIYTMHSFSRIVKRIEKNIDDISDTTKEMFLDIKESSLFHFIFGKKRRTKKDSKEEL